MSTLKEKGKILSLSSFNKDMVAAYYGIPIDGGALHHAMRFMFRVMESEVKTSATSKLAKNRKISDKVIDEIDPRYSHYNNYADDYLGHQFFTQDDRRPLQLAVICGQHVTSINEQIVSKDDVADIEFYDDGIDDVLKSDAGALYDDAVAIIEYGLKKQSNGFIEPHTMLLSQILFLEKLNEMSKDIKTIPAQEKQFFVDRTLPAMLTYADSRTRIGEDVIVYGKLMEAEIKNGLNSSVIENTPKIEKKRPQLTLVPLQPH